jgi:hypothetical protein
MVGVEINSVGGSNECGRRLRLMWLETEMWSGLRLIRSEAQITAVGARSNAVGGSD